ncbi:MAG: DUF6531 domain-containing protein [Defluviitaleaceae bacterium]|nr:DUF6531 domain-containing protein [Defluviitaleaceae bacterium]
MAQVLTHDRIRVDCPYPIQIITDITFTHTFNEHAYIKVQGIIHEAEQDTWIEKMTDNDPIVIYGKTEDGEQRLFSGCVTNVRIRHQHQVYTCEIEGLSHTHLLDDGEYSRSFQNQKMRYSEVIRQVLASHSGARFLPLGNDREIGQFLCQYRESDWEFLIRLASHHGIPLTADIKGDTPRFFFGIPEQLGKITDIRHVVSKKDTQGYQRAKEAGLNVSERDFSKYTFTSLERLELGNRLTFRGYIYLVEAVKAFLNDGILEFQYTIGFERGQQRVRIHNCKIQGVSLLGEVLEARNQALKLKLGCDNEQALETACWFPFASQADNVFYCMPEKGTTISLYFGSDDENSALAVNSVRKNGGNSATMTNPNVKRLDTPYGNEMVLAEQDVHFKIDDGSQMKLDEAGIEFESFDNLDIYSEQNILIQAGESVEITSEKDLLVASGDESQIYMEHDIGDTHLYASGDITQTGYARIAIPSFNEEIEVEAVYEEVVEEPEEDNRNWLQRSWDATVDFVGDVWDTVVDAAVTLVAVVVVVIVVVVVAVAVIKTGGLILAALGAIAGKVSAFVATTAIGKLLGTLGALIGAKWLTFSTYLWGKWQMFKYNLSVLWENSFLGKKFAQLKNWISNTWQSGTESVRNFTNRVKQKIRNVFDPVDPVTGCMFSEGIDFELPGIIPLVWKRTWYSDSQTIGDLGHGMHHNFEMRLETFKEAKSIGIVLADGRYEQFPYLEVGKEHVHQKEGMGLKRVAGHYELFEMETRLTYVFKRKKNNPTHYQLHHIQNEQGYQISLTYDQRHHLKEIVDTVGRSLTIATNQAGRITDISLNAFGTHQGLVHYQYNDAQDLTEITDSLGQTTKLRYSHHLMVQKTDRNKDSFYWQYDGRKSGARVTKSWGEGNLLSGELRYHDKLNYTEVVDLKGYVTQYHYDSRNICTKVIYPDGSMQRDHYNEHLQLERQIDEENRITSFVYNEWAQLKLEIQPDGGKIKMIYDDEGRVISSTNPEGHKQQWLYNEDGTLKQSTDPCGIKTTYAYTDGKLLSAIMNAKGEKIELAYDQQFNVKQVTLPDGTKSKWKYDARGNCIATANPLGAVQRFEYDALNRLVYTKNPDGNEVHLSYNGYEDITRIKDKHTEVLMTYDALGNVTSRKQRNRKVSYGYNNNGQLTLITNEKGETYEFKRDAKGHIKKEVGFDGLTRTYTRDLSGLVKTVKRPNKRWTTYDHDKLGRVISAKHNDDTFDQFVYNKNGELIEAKNQDVSLTFKRDAVGRIVEEMQDGHRIKSTYNELGMRTFVESSLGARISMNHNEMGQISHLAGAQVGQDPWAATMSYNALGQEELRKVSGGVISESQYDIIGRMTKHSVSANNREMRRKKYSWTANHLLGSITDELTDKKTTFSYDRFLNLVGAEYGYEDKLYRWTDEVGNLYQTKDKSDRIYGKGSRLEQSEVNTNELKNSHQGGFGKLVTKGATYHHDGEGNLIKKVEAPGDNDWDYGFDKQGNSYRIYQDGPTWQYAYYGNGMLKQVTKPDGEVVSFKYDSFGRRVEKSTNSKVIKFVWDGNNPLHEFEVSNQQDTLTTWVFKDGFTPSAKLTSEGNYSIISDYLGTPVEAYDESGQKVWEQTLDINGHVRPRPVKKHYGTIVDDGLFDEHFVPFRFAGQYSDVELEGDIYYNRFRYYDPKLGQYMTQDPIGLAGGNPTLYGYVFDTNIEVDPFGWAPWEIGRTAAETVENFISWFDNATPSQIQQNIQYVKRMLRAGGGFHEMFPVSMAAKARELGFSARELLNGTVRINAGNGKLFFTNVRDSTGNLLPNGLHHGSRAGRHFHNQLIKGLQGAQNKAEATGIIDRMHDAHMRFGCPNRG